MSEPLLTWLRAWGFDRANDAADEIEKLQAVVDAACAWVNSNGSRDPMAPIMALSDLQDAVEKYRALDAEQKFDLECLLADSGFHRNTDGEPCPTCKGDGQKRWSVGSGEMDEDGYELPAITPCSGCHGTGRKP